MTYFVIGAGGFLGSTLVKYLQQQGEEVYYSKRSVGAGDSANACALNITDATQFTSVKAKPDVVINCASALPDPYKVFNDPAYLEQLFSTNVLGGANIMNWAAAEKIPRVINCSTLVVVGKPWPVPLKEGEKTYPKGGHVGYSASKLSQELVMSSIAEANGLSLLHLRISALYGPGMKAGGILHKLIGQAAAKENINLTNGNRVSFDFLHVDDAVKAIAHLAKLDEWPEQVINLASGEEITLMELAEVICEQTGCSKEKIINKDDPHFSSRAKVDISLLEKYLQGSGINTGLFRQKVKSVVE
ncbi:NAD(P)-dependent oxidoreductase [Cesiribacter sp. SM1]|uniref:NAD-dependent epimerase/dehydratase family protein n=1 Tax=Cesiribacter sp. SM1 TaxID=2861196 RepID=UPI001CD26B9A|nr:NAD(P)-dependent oxidoreductase [Cesiribacter sp. SM1]